MKTISVLQQKGGSGKTTIAVNLAHALQLDGHSVLLVCSDPQGSARDWNDANEGMTLPVIGLDRETLPMDLKAVSAGYDFIVIDGAPQLQRMCAVTIKISDVVIIPVQPSPYDIWATAELVELIKTRQEVANGLPKAAFVVSRAIINTKLSNEITEALSSYELPVLESATYQRVIYPTTASTGQTVFESTKNGENFAAKEITAIKRDVLNLLEFS